MADTVTGNPTLGAHTGPIDLSRPHFVGVGGSAMSGLAQVCAMRGGLVSGTDAAHSERFTALRAAGCKVEVGHDASAVEGASCVVYTSVAGQAPEVAAARVNGIPVVHRAQVLRELAKDRHLVTVAGTHGKSTTTGMLVAALRQLGQDPSFVVGADLDMPGSGAHHGTGELFVAEADESDRSFHFLEPAATVITGIAHDHPENFDDLDAHLIAYVTFAARMRPDAVLVANADESASMDVVARVRRLRPDVRVLTFGRSEQADVRFGGIERHGWQSQAQVQIGNGLGVVRLDTPSMYHVQDAVAVVALLVAWGYGVNAAVDAVSSFAGVRRRFTPVGVSEDVTVIDCFADHHNEIAADLEAARVLAGDRQVIAVAQPSGYARVRTFARQMGAVLAVGADCTVMLEVHGPNPIPGVSSALVGDAAIMAGGHVRYANAQDAVDLVAALARPGDVVLLLGTGNVGGLAMPILTKLRQNAGQFV